jgi:non-homologous end joining protein Ku
METLIMQTEGKKLKAIKQLLKAMGIAFKAKKEMSPYNPEFVQMIKEQTKEEQQGEFVVMTEDYKKELFDL